MNFKTLTVYATREICHRTHYSTGAWRNAQTRLYQQASAKHHDGVTQNMLRDAKEEKSMLTQYKSKKHKHGKRLLNMRAHATTMIQGFVPASNQGKLVVDNHRQLITEED